MKKLLLNSGQYCRVGSVGTRECVVLRARRYLEQNFWCRRQGGGKGGFRTQARR
jgi:hypothetical protein